MISGKTNPKEDEGGPDLALVHVPLGLRSDIIGSSLSGGGPASRTASAGSSRLSMASFAPPRSPLVKWRSAWLVEQCKGLLSILCMKGSQHSGLYESRIHEVRQFRWRASFKQNEWISGFSAMPAVSNAGAYDPMPGARLLHGSALGVSAEYSSRGA